MGPLKNASEGLRPLGVEALISLGGEIRNLLDDAEASLVISVEIHGKFRGDETAVGPDGTSPDEHGHISISHVRLGRLLTKLLADESKKQTGRSRNVLGLRLSYESRCAKAHAFDVMLGSQLLVAGYRALAERSSTA